VIAIDDTSASSPPPDSATQTQATGWVFLPVACWAASRSLMVTSTRSTPSQLWQTRLNDSGRTIWRAIACRCPQHSHVTTARITPPPGRPIRSARLRSLPPGSGSAAQSTSPRHRRCRFAIRSGRGSPQPVRGPARAPGGAASRTMQRQLR